MCNPKWQNGKIYLKGPNIIPPSESSLNLESFDVFYDPRRIEGVRSAVYQFDTVTEIDRH